MKLWWVNHAYHLLLFPPPSLAREYSSTTSPVATLKLPVFVTWQKCVARWSLNLGLLRKSGSYLCTATYRSVRNQRAKSSGQLVGSKTQSSKPSSPTSPTRFGLTTLRLRSPHFVAAAFAPRSAISAANENGRATRSPPSFPKSSVVTPCGTSKSGRGHKRRPF